MSIPRRALIAITSAHAELFEGGGHTTGVFIGEALHPYNVFKAAGFKVDIVSEKGTWTEDWLSLQPGFLSSEEREQYDDKNSEFRKDMDSNIKAADVLNKEVSSRRTCRFLSVADLVCSTACSSRLRDMRP
jgi:putative intracellular protease/amidase